MEPQIGNQEKDSRDTKDLLQRLAQATNHTLPEIKYVYRTLLELAMDQLANQNRSVDLGFAVIHPIPLRANWKTIILQRFPGLPEWVRGRPAAEADRIMRNDLGVHSEFRCVPYLAMSRGVHHIGLEIVPRKKWWSYMLDVQVGRLKNLGPKKYHDFIGRLIHHLEDKLIHALLSYVGQIALPCGRIVKGNYFGNAVRVVDCRIKGRVCPRHREVAILPVVQRRNPTQLVPDDLEEPLVDPHEGVLEVPDVQPEVKDVRDGGGEPQTQ